MGNIDSYALMARLLIDNSRVLARCQEGLNCYLFMIVIAWISRECRRPNARQALGMFPDQAAS